MTITQLRAELNAWGRYWAAKEALQGYASVSVTERCCEVLRTGIWVSSDKHLFSHHADSILQPVWVKQLDLLVNQLPQPKRALIHSYYVKGKRAIPKNILDEVKNAEKDILTLI